MDDLTLVPLFAPPLRGWLTMAYYMSVGLLTDMIYLFGGIRFRWMDLFNVRGVPLLLGACAETLETLRLYPTNRREGVPLGGTQALADDFSVNFSFDVDLSRNKSLRALEVAASCVVGGSPGFLAHALSTIRSPVFSEVIVFYRDCDFRGVQRRWHPGRDPLCPVSEHGEAQEALWYHKQFEVFREIHKVRDFRLVLRADVWERVGWYALKALDQAVAAEDEKGGSTAVSPNHC